MSSPTIPSVVTRNANQLQNTDWRSLMEFFKKPGATEAFITYCQKKLGIDPESTKKSLDEEEAAIKTDEQNLETRKKELAAKKEQLAAPVAK